MFNQNNPQRAGVCLGRLLAMLVVVWCLGPQTAQAMMVPTYALPRLVQEADIVCVGTVQKIEDGEKAMVGLDVFEGEGQRNLQLSQWKKAHFAVERVFKGELDATAIIAYPETISTPTFDALPYTPFFPGERVMVFLKKGADAKNATLFQPAASPSPKINLGTTVLGDKIHGATAFRQVMMVLVQALGNQDKAIQLDCLRRLQSVGFLLYMDESEFASNSALKKIKAAIGETAAAKLDTSLEDFVVAEVLPSVLKLLASPIVEVHNQAVLTAGRLQATSVMAEIIVLTGSDEHNLSYAANDVLRNFRVPAALRPLIALLQNERVEIRQSAAYALRSVGDPLAVPALLKSLDDPDMLVRQFALSGLFVITNQDAPPRHADDSPTMEKEFIAFWKDWAAHYQDELDKLRAQLNEKVAA